MKDERQEKIDKNQHNEDITVPNKVKVRPEVV